ncbi:hypothetical protein SIN8267_01693 [Sinobacterium norvegicum]|uniref:Uncharacterized protein n=1 Tax=Sinobacterium norvegicum TaxID=1641715 RepID=A0ABN8EK66_9GAMM|nr:hypothetical protein [Sinobacterium norvegicum]CAH0991584.1 hypothetical protein SIN8267_01693 [Sinobacterium norvegicum]
MDAQLIQHSFRQHKHWLAVIEAIKNIQTLSYEVRNHRGATTAQLVGDDFLNSIAFRQQQSADKMLATIERFSNSFPDILQRKEYACISQSWRAIQQQWHNLGPLACFDLHSKLLDYLNKLSWLIAIRTDGDILDNKGGDKSRLSHFIFSHLIQLIESTARLRGIACFHCSKGELNAEDRQELGRLLNTLFQQWSDLQREHKNMPLYSQQLVEDSINCRDMQSLLCDFFDVINPIQNTQEELPVSADIFLSAGPFLAALKHQYNILVDQLAGCMPSNLNHWVNGSSMIKQQGLEL